VGTFRYLRDSLFLVSTIAYVLNRWVLAPALDSSFLSGYFDDLLLIPCGLPVFLWIQRKLGLRTVDLMPHCHEILLHLIIWSVIAECIVPSILTYKVSDPWDFVAYSCGAVLAYLWWRVLPTARISFA
jgi:hypothetical protein